MVAKETGQGEMKFWLINTKGKTWQPFYKYVKALLGNEAINVGAELEKQETISAF